MSFVDELWLEIFLIFIWCEIRAKFASLSVISWLLESKRRRVCGCAQLMTRTFDELTFSNNENKNFVWRNS